MPKYYLGVFLLVTCTLYQLNAQVTVPEPVVIERYDTELWTGGTIKARIAKKWRIELREQAKLDDTISTFTSLASRLSVRYKLSDRVTLRTGYQYSSRVDKTDRSRAALDVNYSWDKKKNPFSWSNRVRFQNTYDLDPVDPDEDRFVMRNKLQFKYDVSKRVQPFAAYEIYYKTHGNPEFSAQRFTGGLNVDVVKKLDAQAFFRRQSDLNTSIIDKTTIYGFFLTYKPDLRKKD